MRLLPVPKYRANCKFNRSKGIVLMTLANNPGWYRPVVISNATGLSLGSLFGFDGQMERPRLFGKELAIIRTPTASRLL